MQNMEVIAPSFILDSASVTPPYMSAPSSPQRFYSPPTSPARASTFCQNYDSFYTANSRGGSLSAIPFIWEEIPGIAKVACGDSEHRLKKDGDFEFDFRVNLQRNSISADELFDGGKIKSLKPPPGFQSIQNKPLESPKSPRSPKKLLMEAFSPRHKVRDFDPFAEALEQTRKSSDIQENRGRERMINSSKTSSSRIKGTRSLSPFRVYDLLLQPDCITQEPTNSSSSSSSSSVSLTSTLSSSSKWCKKWKIMNLFLFKSASEGRATDTDELKKMHQVKESSFISTDSRRPCPPISAHELHYSVRRSVAKEIEKRSLLPHKKGMLGCLGFQQTVRNIPHDSLESSAKLY